MSRLNSLLRTLAILLVVFGFCAAHAATPRIAVVDFDAHQYSGDLPGAQLADYVVDELVNTNLFDVIEREKLKSLMSEMNFGLSGFVDGKTAAKLGKIYGATHLMTGRVISVEREDSSFSGSNYGISGTNVAWNLSISVRIFEVQTGKIVYSDRTRTRWVARNTARSQSTTSTPYDRIAESAAVEVVAGIAKSPFGRGLVAGAASASPQSTAAINVQIDSDPAGADIEVDGVFIGNTGSSYNLSPGIRVIRISRGKAKTWEKKVEVKAGLRINAVLE